MAKVAKKRTVKEQSRTVAKDVVERRIGGANPYFQVRIRRRGHQDLIRRFNYVPDNPNLPAEKKRPGMRRGMAMEEAVKWAATERANLHFYGKPTSQEPSEQTLRIWLLDWVREALDREDINGNPVPEKGQSSEIHPLSHLPVRKSAKTDKRLIMNLIKVADAYAIKNRRPSVMDTRVMDLSKTDFTGPHGILKMITGRPKRDAEGRLPAFKPAASPETQRRLLATLGSVWNHAREEWNLDLKRPWKGIIIRSVEKDQTQQSRRALSVREFELVEQALVKADTHTRSAIEFIRWTGARKGEMVKLRWENIIWPTPENELNHPTIKFEGTKTPVPGAYKERIIHVVPQALEALRNVNPLKDGWPAKGIIFRSPTDPSKPISGYTVYQAMVRAVKRAGLPHAHVHSLRHTRTTEISATLTKAQAMAITGHSDERTFMRYTHLADEVADQLIQADQSRSQKQRKSIIAPESRSADESIDQIRSLLEGLTPEQRLALVAKLIAG